MKDPRFEKLANLLVNYSCGVQVGEIVIIHVRTDVPTEMVNLLVKAVLKVGGIPIVWITNQKVFRTILMNATEESIKMYARAELPIMKKASAYISIRGEANDAELSDVPPDKIALYEKFWYKPVHIKERVENTNWVVLIWPTQAAAQRYEMSTEAFEDFYFDVCAEVDYQEMSINMDPLVELLNKTNRVHIVGPGKTDIAFSIEGLGVVKCCGRRNIPDGEVYTAPVLDSVNGVIQYNTPAIFDGKIFSNICLEFKDGKIINASCERGSVEDLNKILDRDKGARFIGEFALGVNPLINKAVMNTLFDEKIAGSIHFTPGDAYKDTPADNGNKSNVHWDLVLIQTPEYGGGEIFFDDVLIRKDGLFVLPELCALNP